MWQCSALLVSCVLALVLSETVFDVSKYFDRVRGVSAKDRRPASITQVKKSVPREVKRVVQNRRVSEGIRGTRNTLYPFEATQFQDVGQTAPGLVVESSRLNIQAPPSRKYYNPALKKVPFPFDLPVEQPYPFQSTSFANLYPTASGFQLEDGLLPTTAAAFPPTAIASLPPTSIDFTSPEFVADSWRSFQHIPVSAPSAIPNFSTRPPWIPRGGKSDFKPQRGNLQTGSAPGNQVSVVQNTKIPTITAGNVSDLIKMVEQLIIASNQNSTNTTNTAIPNFRRFFKHPSVG
ncbi:unnamed protein product [Nezara viridula]|uniref:Neuropeptide n=1 Tax=Nezara viridula TaxID=85310 RepID=A0A9P0MTC8_NEZVI|nr:unnamed protein product [Nezara viridula]